MDPSYNDYTMGFYFLRHFTDESRARRSTVPGTHLGLFRNLSLIQRINTSPADIANLP